MSSLLIVSSAAAILAQDTAGAKAYWVLSQSNPRTNEVSHAWLVLPPLPVDSARLTLVHGPTVDAWFADSTGSCADVTMRERKLPPRAGQEVVPVCMKPREAETTRLLAQIRTWSAAGARTSYVAPSDPITSRGRKPLTATQLALVSAMVGLVAGVLTQVFQIFVTSRTRAAETSRSIHQELVRHLLPEMRIHAELLRAHSSGARLDESLPMNAYQRLEDDEGILGFLGAKERKAYLRTLRQYYARAEEYNVALDEGDAGSAARLGAAMLSSVSTLIGKAGGNE